MFVPVLLDSVSVNHPQISISSGDEGADSLVLDQLHKDRM